MICWMTRNDYESRPGNQIENNGNRYLVNVLFFFFHPVINKTARNIKKKKKKWPVLCTKPIRFPTRHVARVSMIKNIITNRKFDHGLDKNARKNVVKPTRPTQYAQNVKLATVNTVNVYTRWNYYYQYRLDEQWGIRSRNLSISQNAKRHES